MRKSLWPVVVVMLSTAAWSVEGTQAVLPRHPAPSPDGTQVAFSWQGDIWLAPIEGGVARRLTANPGYDHHPVWRADGATLLFASDRGGSDDVYALDLATGTPLRLTFHEAADLPQGTIGEDVVFTSRRHDAFDRSPAVYSVPLAGGTESLEARVLALEAVPSPDGRRVALVRGGTPADRRHYRGAANRDLWLLERSSGALQRLTSTDWDEDGVSWAGDNALVYRSDGGGDDRNLYRLDLADHVVTQLTHHVGQDVRSPSVSADGSVAAYELWDSVYSVPTDASASPRRIELEVPADALEPGTEREVKRADADEAAVSPDGTQVALVVEGDVYVAAIRDKETASVAPAPTVRVTDTVGRERDLAWSPDGTALLYASDRDGQWDLYTVQPADADKGAFFRAHSFRESRLTADPADERAGTFSPDGKLLAYVRGKGDLTVANADGSQPRTLFQHWQRISFVWSPDSRWLAFTREDPWYNADVFIVRLSDGATANVSQHPDEDASPVWSPDSRRLYWLSRRHNRSMDVWSVYLTRADDERTPEQWLSLWEETKEPKGPDRQGRGKEAKGGEEKPAVPAMAVDLERIAERARALTDLPGDEGDFAVSPDGKTVAFVAAPEGEADLYAVRWDGKDVKRLTNGGKRPSQVAFSKDGKRVFYRTSRGTVESVTVEGKPSDPITFAARVEVDRMARRGEVFDEAWRELDTWFYDPAFHGHDWKAIGARYRPLALAASTQRDFDDVMNLMLGELDASHMGFRRRGEGGTRTGDLGVEVRPATGGAGVEIVEVLPDTPAARTDVNLKVGDRIVAVGGREITPRDNLFDLLNDAVGQPITVQIVTTAGERTVVVTPQSVRDTGQDRYRQWVRERRAMVDRLSEGKLGYIHIQGMDMPSLEEFQRDLFAAANGREGLLIDVRNNGGGWTTDLLMTMLTVKRHAWTVPRDGDPAVRAYPNDRLPMPAWTRPAATLCDQASYSNAEIFSWAFKTLKRGPVVGQRTFGAVISTGGAGLADGSYVRLPGRGWYVAGSGTNMERNGCPPDVVVEQPPQQDMDAQHDAQLERAVEVLLEQLPSDPSRLPW